MFFQSQSQQNFFCRYGQTDPNIYMERQRNQSSQNDVEKEPTYASYQLIEKVC